MNRKLFGKNLAVVLFLLGAGVVASCSEKIVGNPQKVAKEYIEAVQKGDFLALYHLNRSTARQSKYILSSDVGDVKKADAENLARAKAGYDSVEPGFHPGSQWGEKYLFPASAKVVIGKPRNPQLAAKDTFGDNYEKGNTVIVIVSASYPSAEQAPEYHGNKLKYAEYSCMLGKIRADKSVMIYTYDENWYFNGCFINSETAQYR